MPLVDILTIFAFIMLSSKNNEGTMGLQCIELLKEKKIPETSFYTTNSPFI